MTDFLTSLTARSFGKETVVRPRPTSMFEPVRHGDTTLQEAPAVEPDKAEIAKEIVTGPDGRQEKRGPSPVIHGESQNSSAIRAVKDEPVATVVPQAQVGAAYVGTTINKDKPWEDEHAITASAPAPAASLSQKDRANISLLPLHLNIEEPPGRLPIKEQGATAARVEPFEKSNHEPSLPPGVMAQLTEQMKNAVLAMNPGPAAPARKNAGRPAQPSTAESEPSVRVTIGRIEVRATAESKQDRRPRSASPVMSLEQYLRGRQRGEQ